MCSLLVPGLLNQVTPLVSSVKHNSLESCRKITQAVLDIIGSDSVPFELRLHLVMHADGKVRIRTHASSF